MNRTSLSCACILIIAPLALHAAQVQVPKTGQRSCYSATGILIDCAGTGQDGDGQTGADWPAPRFTDNRNGTVTDILTGLIWLKDANCTDEAGGVKRTGGLLDWQSALTWSNALASGKCGLKDNSAAGDWRLPNINELRSLIDYSRHDPALPLGHPFSNVQSAWYWSSTSNPVFTAGAFTTGLSRGSIHTTPKTGPVFGASRVSSKGDKLGVWPVRNARQ